MKHLSGDLGVESADDQKKLDALQTEWITTETSNIKQLIAQEKFDEANTRLKDMETHGPQPELRSELDKAKSDHEVSVAKALSDVDAQVTAGDQKGAYQTATDAASKDKLEPRLQLRVANLELSMPSSYDRVTNRLKALAALRTSHPEMDQNADFNQLTSVFQKNLDKHNIFRDQIAALRKQVDSYAPRIASLRADAKHNQDKKTGYTVLSVLGLGGAAGAASQNNFAGTAAGLGATGVGQNGANARENDIRSDNARISELQSQQAAKQAQLDDLRAQYNQMQQSPINSVQ